MVTEPYPELDEMLKMMGDVGKHLADIGACEGAAGNISVCMRWPVELLARFPVVDEINLPQPVPELAGAKLLVSGSGRRLREIIDDPTANIACIIIKEGERTGKLCISHHRPLQQLLCPLPAPFLK